MQEKLHRSARALGLAAAAALFASAGTAMAQQVVTGYGVNAQGSLFRFNVDSPGTVTTIGNMGIVPEAIDFRPLTAAQQGGTPVLYAIDVGPNTTQVFTVNTSTAAVTPLSTSFPSSGAGYNLINQQIGFDFNPTTLQADGSARIRVTATNGANLRLNSTTGAIAATDTALAYGPAPDPNAGGSPFVDGSAYINSNVLVAAAGGTTVLYDMDGRTDDLSTQNPPNSGTLNTVGSFGVTVDANPGMGFDIFTAPGSTDATIGGDRALAVLERDATQNGAYLLYEVNLATGVISNGRLVGNPASPADFTGGFAVVPEPSAAALLLLGAPATALLRRRRSRA